MALQCWKLAGDIRNINGTAEQRLKIVAFWDGTCGEFDGAYCESPEERHLEQAETVTNESFCAEIVKAK